MIRLLGELVSHPFFGSYLLIVNAVLFAGMGLDKRKAVRGGWRTSERTLIVLAALGGSLGGVIAMRTFRHKTRKPVFRYGFPVLLALHMLLLAIGFTAG